MKEKVQSKINYVRQLAKTSVSGSQQGNGTHSHPSDSLSDIIRNSKEATVFLAELDAAIRVSSKK